MLALLTVLLEALRLYSFVVIVSAIMSWLLAFNVINYRNEFVRAVANGLSAVTEPALRPIRRILPNLGGVDISPIILLLLIMLVQQIIILYLVPLAAGTPITAY